MSAKIRVGIIGLQPGRSWAARAHLPALRALSDTYEVVGVANTSRASAEAAAQACRIPLAFDGPAALAASPDIDLVAVTVRVPYHLALVREVVRAGKHVYCEWPLGNGLAEAEEMEALVRERGVLGVAGTQARVAPEILHLRRLIAEGYVGRVLSSTLTAHGRSWGPTQEDFKNRAYLLDRRNGASMLTIPLGHTLAALRDVLGDLTELSAIVANRRGTTRDPESGADVPFDAPDQVVVCGRIGDGAPISIHYRGGMPRGPDGLIWEINGTEGDLRLLAIHGGTQQVALRIEGGRDADKAMAPIAVPPETDGPRWPEDVNPGNVARVYARMAEDLRHGTRTAPTFADAVMLHKLIAGIEEASASGARLRIDAPNRPLPMR